MVATDECHHVYFHYDYSWRMTYFLLAVVALHVLLWQKCVFS